MKYIELFCGCGGQASGLRDAGWECLLGVDHDPYALGVYGANFPEHPLLQHDLNEPLGDAVSQEMRATLRNGGVLVGGSPCQDFALTCKPDVRDRQERAQLTRAFGRHVADLEPEFVIFENIKYAAHRKQFLALLEDLTALGYVTDHRVLCIRDLGMTQPRYRLIMIAHRGSRDAVQRVWNRITEVIEKRPPVATMRQTFEAYGAPIYGKNHVYYPVPRAIKGVQPSIFSLDDRGERRALFTVRGRTRPMPRTYVYVQKDSSTDRDDIFAIETVHLLALQGFPRSFVLHGPKGKQDQAIGNAVPPPLARIIGEAFSLKN